MLEAILLGAGIPSAITGFCFWLVERRISKREQADREERIKRQQVVDDRERAREQHMICMVKSTSASMALAEATARAVQRIPDAHCNGDMHAALDYAAQVKHELKDFTNEQAIKNLF